MAEVHEKYPFIPREITTGWGTLLSPILSALASARKGLEDDQPSSPYPPFPAPPATARPSAPHPSCTLEPDKRAREASDASDERSPPGISQGKACPPRRATQATATGALVRSFTTTCAAEQSEKRRAGRGEEGEDRGGRGRGRGAHGGW